MFHFCHQHLCKICIIFHCCYCCRRWMWREKKIYWDLKLKWNATRIKSVVLQWMFSSGVATNLIPLICHQQTAFFKQMRHKSGFCMSYVVWLVSVCNKHHITSHHQLYVCVCEWIHTTDLFQVKMERSAVTAAAFFATLQPFPFYL